MYIGPVKRLIATCDSVRLDEAKGGGVFCGLLHFHLSAQNMFTIKKFPHHESVFPDKKLKNTHRIKCTAASCGKHWIFRVMVANFGDDARRTGEARCARRFRLKTYR